MSEQAEVNFLTLFPIEPQVAVELQDINDYRISQLGGYSTFHSNFESLPYKAVASLEGDQGDRPILLEF